jgi:glycosyltransferase involved in cell wall biosynthesis
MVKVYLTTHNQKALLTKAVNSVLEQAYDNFELITVNDGTSDNTKAVLDKFYGNNPKVRIIHLKAPKGACHARNVAI